MKAHLFTAIAFGISAAAIAALPMTAQAQSLPTDYNYVGAGVGISDTVGLSINSKITVADHVSVRPGVISDLNFSGNGQTSFHLPVTYDFNAITPNGKLLPYVGGGVSAITGNENRVGPMVTAGMDYRISDRFTLNGGVNVSLYNNTRVNGTLGVGYTF
ncbi:outer membrane beta-barrel protein [Leptolyngbya sp. PCC 6406]|uniref:outer membrane beta-barrel protein n=1 Tax=Leptolyngbya sp. PCC 6406 TaxID=1173264 RepID=UPI0002ABA0DC|nr:outer membrane beta-barrel protein [Leptolyngbya sp. PCC 6406]